jgi:predicted DNA-binding protein YlxM (UPF0122 family)
MKLDTRNREILSMSRFYSYSEVGREYGVTRQAIGKVVKELLPEYKKKLLVELRRVKRNYKRYCLINNC